ncbi:MAG: carbohydrate ABC transporter permease [Halanaerobium sp.]
MKSYKELSDKYPFLKALPFMLPFALAYSIFLIYPIFRGFWMSLHRWTMVRNMGFVGLNNYLYMIKDPAFWESLGNTLLFVLISTPTIVIGGLVLALLANQKIRGQLFIKISFFLPYVLSVAVISSIMVYFFQPHSGLLNDILGSFGVEKTIFWLGETKLAWFVINFATLWWTVGFNMILYLAALQDIPESFYEAAEVDGATKFQQLRYITLPSLKPITWVVTLLQVIFSFKIFSQVWLITGGGPGTDTRPIVQYIYETSFKQNSMGYGAAMAFAFFIILVLVSMAQIYLRKRKEG